MPEGGLVAAVVEGYTEEFERTFMEHLRRSHPHSRVSAKVVYNEYIADRHHIHMNSTSWLTLTDFVKYLGKTGQCRVDQTEKGWFISVIQADPSQALAEEKKGKRERAEKVCSALPPKLPELVCSGHLAGCCPDAVPGMLPPTLLDFMS